MSEDRVTLLACGLCTLAREFAVLGMAVKRGWVQVGGVWLCPTCARKVANARAKQVTGVSGSAGEKRSNGLHTG